MPWANPFRKEIDEVLALTQPPPDVELPPGPEAIAVGLLMRARILLRATALLADRLLGGATDPLVRSILEVCFTAGWLLADPGGYEIYLGHYRKKWRQIAEAQTGKPAPLNPSIRAELAFFLDRSRTDMPPEANLGPFDQQAKTGGFEDFYSLYAMASRRAHPDLNAAKLGLIEQPDLGVMRVNASPIAAELADAYVKMSTYLVARLGAVIAEHLNWENASELVAYVDRLRAEAEADFAAAKAKVESEEL